MQGWNKIVLCWILLLFLIGVKICHTSAMFPMIIYLQRECKPVDICLLISTHYFLYPCCLENFKTRNTPFFLTLILCWIALQMFSRSNARASASIVWKGETGPVHSPVVKPLHHASVILLALTCRPHTQTRDYTLLSTPAPITRTLHPPKRTADGAPLWGLPPPWLLACCNSTAPLHFTSPLCNRTV